MPYYRNYQKPEGDVSKAQRSVQHCKLCDKVALTMVPDRKGGFDGYCGTHKSDGEDAMRAVNEISLARKEGQRNDTRAFARMGHPTDMAKHRHGPFKSANLAKKRNA